MEEQNNYRKHVVMTCRSFFSLLLCRSVLAAIGRVTGNPRLGVAGSPGANLPSIWRTVKGQGPLKWPYIYVVNSVGIVADDGGIPPTPGSRAERLAKE